MDFCRRQFSGPLSDAGDESDVISKTYLMQGEQSSFSSPTRPPKTSPGCSKIKERHNKSYFLTSWLIRFLALQFLIIIIFFYIYTQTYSFSKYVKIQSIFLVILNIYFLSKILQDKNNFKFIPVDLFSFSSFIDYSNTKYKNVCVF